VTAAMSDRSGEPIRLLFDGYVVEGRPYDTIASALWAAGIVVFGTARKLATPRTLVCGEGWCWSCAVMVEGAGEVLACQTPIREGMIVRRLLGDPPLTAATGDRR